MTKGVECVSPTSSLQEAAQKMKNLGVDPLPVCGNNDHFVGLLTDHDITVRAVAEACDPRNTAVKDVMTQDTIFCYEEEDVQEAARKMQEHQVSRLVVLSRDQRVVGVVSLDNVAVPGKEKKPADTTPEKVPQPT